jgi:hypothetical protein
MYVDIVSIWEEEKRIFPNYSIKFRTPHISYKDTDKQQNRISYLTVRFEDTLSFSYSCLDGTENANREPIANEMFSEKEIPKNINNLPSMFKALVCHIEQTYGTNQEIINWVKSYEARSKMKKYEIDR